MATEGPGRAGVPALTSLPRYEDLPLVGDGLDADRVREAFDAFRRHAAQLTRDPSRLAAVQRERDEAEAGNADRRLRVEVELRREHIGPKLRDQPRRQRGSTAKACRT